MKTFATLLRWLDLKLTYSKWLPACWLLYCSFSLKNQVGWIKFSLNLHTKYYFGRCPLGISRNIFSCWSSRKLILELHKVNPITKHFYKLFQPQRTSWNGFHRSWPCGGRKQRLSEDTRRRHSTHKVCRLGVCPRRSLVSTLAKRHGGRIKRAKNKRREGKASTSILVRRDAVSPIIWIHNGAEIGWAMGYNAISPRHARGMFIFQFSYV